MTKGKKAVLLVLLAWSAIDYAQAGTWKTSTTKNGRIVVSFSGEIVEGDADAFKAALKAANDSGKLVTSLRLNSIGGNLLEGVKLSETAKFAKVATNVGQGATCASACFLVFAAGETKFANYTAQVGVHGASDETGEETVQSGAATVSMARVAKDLGVPPAIIGRMVVTPPAQMVWLSPADLRSMGPTMVGKPSQIGNASRSKHSTVTSGRANCHRAIRKGIHAAKLERLRRRGYGHVRETKWRKTRLFSSLSAGVKSLQHRDILPR